MSRIRLLALVAVLVLVASACRYQDRALSMQPYDFIALLAKGALLEKLGKPKAAVASYKNALKIAPPQPVVRAFFSKAKRRTSMSRDNMKAAEGSESDNEEDRLDLERREGGGGGPGGGCDCWLWLLDIHRARGHHGHLH